MVRIALLALMVLALDLAWWLAPGPDAVASWPRTAKVGACSLTLHEPRRDPAADESGAHTLRLAFSCEAASPRAGAGGAAAPATLRGTAVVIGYPQVEAGTYAMSGARIGLISLPTVLEPGSEDASECRSSIEALLAGSTLFDGDPRFGAGRASEPLLAGPDSRVYALRAGAWWREETDGSWMRIAPQGSAAARRDARLAPLERALAQRQLRDGR